MRSSAANFASYRTFSCNDHIRVLARRRTPYNADKHWPTRDPYLIQFAPAQDDRMRICSTDKLIFL
jgi:hypothetical protein